MAKEALIGKKIANKYLVKHLLGKGGNGEVYLIEYQKKEYALKILSFCGKYRFKKYNRFKREIRLVQKK